MHHHQAQNQHHNTKILGHFVLDLMSAWLQTRYVKFSDLNAYY